MNTTEHALDTLRRAAEHGYPWSIYPAEARALVAEVERLRNEVSLLQQEARIRHNISEALTAELKAERAALTTMQGAYELGADTERAAVVAWLRREIAKCGCDDDTAACIERGEHRREEEG